MSFSTTTLDFYDDHGELLRTIVPDPDDLPPFLKTAAVQDRSAPANMWALVLLDGDEVLCKYATGDPGNTWLSMLYFYETGGLLPEKARAAAAANLVKAAEAFGLPVPEEIVLAAGDGDGNLVEVTQADVLAPDDVESGFSFSHAAGIEEATSWFDENHGRMNPRERRGFAVTVAAAHRGPGLPTSVRTYASSDKAPHLGACLQVRREVMLDLGLQEEADLLSKVASASKKLHSEVVADFLDKFDRKAGLDLLWDRFIPDPWFSTFGLKKQAEHVGEHLTWVGNEAVTDEDVERLAERGRLRIAEVFGNDFANKFCRDPAAHFKSMAEADKVIVAKMAVATING